MSDIRGTYGPTATTESGSGCFVWVVIVFVWGLACSALSQVHELQARVGAVEARCAPVPHSTRVDGTGGE